MLATPSFRRTTRVVLSLCTIGLLTIGAPGAAVADPPPATPQLPVPHDGTRPGSEPSNEPPTDDPLTRPGSGDRPDSRDSDEDVPSQGAPIMGPGITRGPYATLIAEKAKDVATLGKATTAAEEEAITRGEVATSSAQKVRALNKQADELTALATDMAAKSYQESAAEIRGFTDEFDALFEIRPHLLTLDRDAIVQEAADAQESAKVAQASLDAANAAQAIADEEHEKLDTELKAGTEELEKLVADNAEALRVQEAKQNADNKAKYDLSDIGEAADGLIAATEAQEAVKFALSQVGKPYVWGAEGPDSYDCSGLIQTAYGNQGLSLPRIANDQYRNTSGTSVDAEKMLPGDLIFYGDNPGDWTSVYHVGMYIGNGEMVHAPQPGSTVTVAPVPFDGWFGVTRAAEATPAEDDKADDKKDDEEKETQEPSDDASSPSESPEATRDEEETQDDAKQDSTSDSGDGTPTPSPSPTG